MGPGRDGARQDLSSRDCMILSPGHQTIIDRGLSDLAPLTRAAARLYVESILRPIREINDRDIRQAVAAALAKVAA
jgi:hypothetical protein